MCEKYITPIGKIFEFRGASHCDSIVVDGICPRPLLTRAEAKITLLLIAQTKIAVPQFCRSVVLLPCPSARRLRADGECGEHAREFKSGVPSHVS